MPPIPHWRENKVKLILLGLVLVLDLICGFLLYASINDWNGNAWNPSYFGSLLTRSFAFNVADTLLVTVFRVVALPLFIFLGVQWGSPQLAISAAEAQRREATLNARRDGSRQHDHHGHNHNHKHAKNDEEVVSLLVDEDDDDDNDVDTASTKSFSEPLLDINDSTHETTSKDATTPPSSLSSSHGSSSPTLSEKEKYVIKLRTEVNQNLIQALIFVLVIGSEVLAGIKSVVFKFPHENEGTWNHTFSATAMCLPVLWMTLELFLARELLSELAKDTGQRFPAIHPHPLYYTDNLPGHWCDLCRRRRLREAYRCTDCDFDLCLSCAKRKNKDRGEGIIRGDSGIKQEWNISNWEYMKKAIVFAKPNVFLIALAIIFLLINSGVNLLTPNYQGKILDNVLAHNVSGFSRDILVYVGLSVSLGIFGAIRNLCFNIVGQRMGNLVRNTLYSSIIVQDIAFFDGMDTGDLTSRVLWNTTAMISPVQTLISSSLSATITLLGGLGMCFYTSWRLSILALTTIGPIILLYRIYAKWSSKINRLIWAALGDANSLATQALTNIRTVRAFGTEMEELDRFKTSTAEALSKGTQDAVASAGTFTLTQMIEYGISVLVLWYGGTVVMDQPDILSIGKLITFQLYLNMLQNAGSSLSNIVNEFTKAGGAAQRVMSLLQSLPDIDPSAGIVLKDLKAGLEMQDVQFYYQMRPEQQVLKGVNLSIKPGQVCALVGKSGGGKSTIVHLLMRFYNPKGGRILLDGVDLSTLNPTWLRKNIGIVAQETQLFNVSIEENIAYGIEHYTKEELHEAARLANCHDFIMSFDEGYETRVGERGIRLSGGQKQRIAIARVFLRKPKLLFLDEATSSLDAESEALVQEAIDRLIATSGCTVVLVAHRLSTVVNADIIGVVHEGKIVEHGNHDQLVKLGGVYAKLVSRQLAKMQNTLDQESGPSKATKNKADVIDNLIDE